MRADKTRNAELLFDAIGDIDDRLIQEAQAPFVKTAPSRRYNTKAIIALAATLTVALMILSTVMIAKVVGKILKNDVGDLKGQSPDVETSASLDHVLINCAPDATIIESAEDIDFFDGNTKIVWQVEGESNYKMVTLTSKSDAAALQKKLINADQSTPATTESQQCRLWITFGDGRVVSPYLKNSAGNTGYAELFEYSPEVELDDDLIGLIYDLISN